LGGLDSPTSGEINYGHKDICKLSGEQLAEFRNRELGYVWQMHSLLAEFTAVENVMMPLLIRGESRDEARKVALARLDEVVERADHWRLTRGRQASFCGPPGNPHPSDDMRLTVDITCRLDEITL
jgi:ABC-type lipoprotein export system ATPase subunit